LVAHQLSVKSGNDLVTLIINKYLWIFKEGYIPENKYLGVFSKYFTNSGAQILMFHVS